MLSARTLLSLSPFFSFQGITLPLRRTGWPTSASGGGGGGGRSGSGWSLGVFAGGGARYLANGSSLSVIGLVLEVFLGDGKGGSFIVGYV